MAFIVCRKPQPSILLGQSPYYGTWMAPQEGVQLKETFEEALRRCLEVECGCNLLSGKSKQSRKSYLRSIRYMGRLPLPKSRVGERPIADDAIGTWLEPVRLRSKAYWMASIWIDHQSNAVFKADGKELVDLKWFTFEAARLAIRETNHLNKGRLLLTSLDACERDFMGAGKPQP